MADDTTDTTGWDKLLQGAITAGTAAGSLGVNQAAYADAIAKIEAAQKGYADNKVPDYQTPAAFLQGDTGLKGLTYSPQAEAAESGALSSLQDIQKSGGLTLADKTALANIEDTLNRNNSARLNQIQNTASRTGGVNSGSALAQALSATQNSAQNANSQGSSAAAQAQARALQAIQQQANLGRQMGNDQYSRQADAAKAQDMINARNTAAQTSAARYGNDVKGMTFADNLKNLSGESGLIGNLTNLIVGKGQNLGNGISGAGQGINSGLGSLGGKNPFGGGGGGGGGGGDGLGTGSGSGTPGDPVDDVVDPNDIGAAATNAGINPEDTGGDD